MATPQTIPVRQRVVTIQATRSEPARSIDQYDLYFPIGLPVACVSWEEAQSVAKSYGFRAELKIDFDC